jgi:hypothetical protein
MWVKGALRKPIAGHMRVNGALRKPIAGHMRVKGALRNPIAGHMRVKRAGLYNATKSLTFASYFCKMRVKIPYWNPNGELIFLEHFHSLTDTFFQFKFRLWFSGFLPWGSKYHMTPDIKVKITYCKWPRLAKIKTSQNVSLKINRLNQLITKLACLMQHWRKHKSKYWWRFRF